MMNWFSRGSLSTFNLLLDLGHKFSLLPRLDVGGIELLLQT